MEELRNIYFKFQKYDQNSVLLLFYFVVHETVTSIKISQLTTIRCSSDTDAVSITLHLSQSYLVKNKSEVVKTLFKKIGITLAIMGHKQSKIVIKTKNEIVQNPQKTSPRLVRTKLLMK